jgi:hypothetical protein
MEGKVEFIFPAALLVFPFKRRAATGIAGLIERA